MSVQYSETQVLVTEELFNMLRNLKLREGRSRREDKRKLIKMALEEKQKEGNLEILERIVWAALRYEKYSDQVKFVKTEFGDLRRRAGSKVRKLLDAFQ